MGRHRFDPIALLVGLVFVAGGVIVLAGGRLVDEGRMLAPLALVGLGVALLVRPSFRAPPAPPGPSPGPVAPPEPVHPPGSVDPPGPGVAPGPDDVEAPAGDEPVDRPVDVPPSPGQDFYLGPDWRPPAAPGHEHPTDPPPE